MKKILLLPLLLCSCTTDGVYDPVATRAAIDTVGAAYNQGQQIYHDARYGYQRPVVPVTPVVPVAPVTPYGY